MFYARTNNHLPDLHSARTSFDCEEYAFASEFAATELKYRTGASSDDILCDPGLAAQFDAIARRLARGFSSLQYRWAILSIRKAGRHQTLNPDFRVPELTGQFRFMHDRLEVLPAVNGVYMRQERERPPYARATSNLRHGIEIHRRPEPLTAVADKPWRPNPNDLLVRYATLPQKTPKKTLLPIEKQLVEEQRPIFNVPRAA
jgi:site-specific DNA-methyltransferase (adenine-specific)